MTEKKEESGGVSRRDFLKDAGLLVGGTAIGSTVLLAACGGDGEATVTRTVTNTSTVTQGGATVTMPGATVTQTVGGGATVTATETETKFVCPTCGMEFDTLSLLKAHFDSTHPTEAVPGELTTLIVNGRTYALPTESNWTLAHVLRDKLGLTGTMIACDQGACGNCTVLIGNEPYLACLTLATECDGKEITTVEGLVIDGIMDPIQESFISNDAMQCGFCVPGAIMATKALLIQNSNPSREDVKTALSGVICRCGAHVNMVEAVLEVS